MSPPGLYHDPDKFSGEQIETASAAVRENDIFGLGPHSKAGVDAAVAEGDPRVNVTERQPDGTEVKTSNATAGMAPDQAAKMEETKTAGNTVGTEPVDQVIKEREDSILLQMGWHDDDIEGMVGAFRADQLRDARAQGYKPEPDKAPEEAPRGIDAVITDRENSILRQMGWHDDDIGMMNGAFRADQVQEAQASGITAEPAAPQAAKPKAPESPKAKARYDALHAKVLAGDVRGANGKLNALLQVAQSIKYVNGELSRDELKALVRRYGALNYSNGVEREAALWQIVRDFSNPEMFNSPETYSIVDAHGLTANVHVVRGKDGHLDALFIDDGGALQKSPIFGTTCRWKRSLRVPMGIIRTERRPTRTKCRGSMQPSRMLCAAAANAENAGLKSGTQCCYGSRWPFACLRSSILRCHRPTPARA
jgi:hypothetical protein